MNKKQFSKKFRSQLQRARDLIEPMADDEDFVVNSALAAACSDALIFSLLKMNGWDVQDAAAGASDMVNISLKTAQKLKNELI